MYQSNGVTIPPNAMPSNWLDSIPWELRLRLYPFVTCPNSQNGALQDLSPSQDYWMFILFETSPKWEFYQARNIVGGFKLILGIGGGGSLSCDSESQDCSLSSNLELGEGLSVLNYEIALSFGVEGEVNFDKGTIDLGGTVDIGNCTLYVSLVRISVSCGNFLDPLSSYEMGFKRDKLEEYLVLVDWNKIGPLGYEEFARRFLHFKNRDAHIYYQILDTDQSLYHIVLRHADQSYINFR